MMEDLSAYHQPLGGWFALPRGPEERDRYRLSEEQVAFYHENGYLPGIRILTDEQVERLREELAGLMDPAHPRHHLFYEYHSNESQDPNTVLFHALGAWRITPGFHDILWHPAFTVPASQLLGGAVRFWHDQLFCKPPRQGGVVAWHQDYSYWTRTQPQAHLSCWIGLDDATEENGALMYIPGSHRWNLLPITGLAGDMDAIMSVLTEEQKARFKPVTVELKKGECSFHHAMVVHGSGVNHSDRPRRATVINVFRAAHVEYALGPHVPGYIPLKQRVLLSCIEKRQQADYVGGEEPFVYNPPEPFTVQWTSGTVLPTYRYVHQDYWRK